MIIVQNKEELLNSFRTLDRDQVSHLPQGGFPLAMRPYLSWSEPSHHKAFLLFPHESRPVGAVFRSSQGGGNHAQFCQWCHAVKPPQGIELLVAQASLKTSVGVWVCKGISCKDSMKDPQSNGLREALEPGEKLIRFQLNLQKFVLKNLY